MVFPILVCATMTLTNAADVASALADRVPSAHIALQGTVVCLIEPGSHVLVLQDASGSTTIVDDRSSARRSAPLKPGDVVRATGRVSHNNRHVSAPCNDIELLGRVAPPPPKDVTIGDVKAGRHDYGFVRIAGTVRESFRDELDPHFVFLVLSDGSGSIYAAVYADDAEIDFLRTLTGSEVSVLGVCRLAVAGQRRQLGRMISLCNANSISVRKYSREAPFDVPALAGYARLDPDQVRTLGRRRLAGRVLAVWQGDRAILEDDAGEVHNVRFADGVLPAYGADIEAEGFPATDLYRVNLTGATWRRRTNAPDATNAPPAEVTAADLLNDADGRSQLKAGFHGKTVRIRGTVLDLQSAEDRRGRLMLKSGEHAVPVDASACRAALDGVSVGCRVEVTGCCAMETENWNSYSAFPRATGIAVVLRKPDDVVILAAPPWWTPGRFLAVIGSMLAFLAVLLVWSLSLWRIAIRRGRLLLKAQVEQIGSELRVEERTRLAVELHDSISQNLTGVSMQIDAAERWLDTDRGRTVRHLDIASRTLTSCREELRNCIWDLRSQAFEEHDMNEAIRRTLHQRLGGASLTVRFNVPRARLTENTAHALLRIIRELAANAVKHGQATAIRVAGAIDGGHLLFSVSDNGTGFDPDDRPGIAEGHFGLQGIAERIRRFNGEMKIESASGKSCRVSVSLKMPTANKEE